jgi:Zn-dependent protease with chaperone function
MVTWASVAALSVILSYLITLLLGLVSLGFGVVLLVAMLQAGPSLFAVILAAFALVVGGTVLWSLLPRKIPFETNGALIDLSREVRLRAEILGLANALNEKIPDEIYLVPFANAAVLERGKRRIMLLGVPVLQLLTVSQFRAILAHEFGHYYAGDTRMGPWVYRARANMAQVLIRLSRDSVALSFLSRLAAVAILRLAILGGLSLWWKLFNRLTQHVSRKQEYRCDELACYLAGSESLEKGLCSVSRAAATFVPYWNQVVMPVTTSGYRPQLAEGFARFVQAPEIAKAASALIEKQLASNATNPMDSHPPLNARVEKARTLAIATPAEDNRPAVGLLDDLPGLELQLLTKLMPALKPSELKPIQWDNAGLDVYVPLWRSEVAKFASALNSVTIYTLPKALAKLTDIAGRIPDPPGTLLTREQRAGRAAELMGQAMTLVLIDHGWRLYLQPGQFYVESENGSKMNPRTFIEELRNGSRKADAWLQYCEANAIGDWPLVPQLAPPTS